jgi:hypothetical protein
MKRNSLDFIPDPEWNRKHLSPIVWGFISGIIIIGAFIVTGYIIDKLT